MSILRRLYSQFDVNSNLGHTIIEISKVLFISPAVFNQLCPVVSTIEIVCICVDVMRHGHTEPCFSFVTISCTKLTNSYLKLTFINL